MLTPLTGRPVNRSFMALVMIPQPAISTPSHCRENLPLLAADMGGLRMVAGGSGRLESTHSVTMHSHMHMHTHTPTDTCGYVNVHKNACLFTPHLP